MESRSLPGSSRAGRLVDDTGAQTFTAIVTEFWTNSPRLTTPCRHLPLTALKV